MIGALAVVLAMIVPGCGAGDGAGDGAVTVYVSVPLQGVRGVEGRAIADGARLALEQAGGRAGKLEVRAVYLDDTGRTPKWSPVATAANARRAAEDSSAIGYIGELDSGATRISLPITNQAGMIQISPGSTAIDLTGETSAASAETYRPSGDRNFARIVADDEAQARAAAALAARLGLGTIAVVREQSSFGAVLAEEFIRSAREEGIGAASVALGELAAALRSASLGFDGIYYGGAAADDFAAVARAAGASGLVLIASDAVPGYGRRVCPQLHAPLYVTSAYAQPGSRFEAQPAAAYGYEAMSLLLDAIRRGGADRGAVIDEVLATEDRSSPIGSYSIDGRGDTTLDRIAVYSVRDCERSFDRELRAAR